MHFYKLHGAGNDYLFFDGFAERVDAVDVQALCDRHFGIGADGVVIVEADRTADARMRMYNADGSRGAICGNALRCVGALLRRLGYADRDTIAVATDCGVRTVTLERDGGRIVGARVGIGVPRFDPTDVPTTADARIIDRPVRIGGETVRVTCLSMGNPHCVVFEKNPDALDLGRIGPLYEHCALFPDGVNTEWVSARARNRLSVRVYERGSGETLACGSGACAAAVASVLRGDCDRNTPIEVTMRGGVLTVTVGDGGVELRGPVRFVCEGDTAPGGDP